MKPQRFTKQFGSLLDTAVRLCKEAAADAVLVLLDGPTDWDQLRTRADGIKLIVAGDTPEEVQGSATGQST